MSGTSSLNRSVQGLWSAQRKARININAPPGSAAAAAALSLAAGQSDPTTADSNGAAEPLPLTTDTAPPLPASEETLLANGKRKTRTVRPNETSKRQKSAGYSSSSGISKDHAPPSTRLSDLGGVQPCVEKMMELVAMPLSHPEIYLHTGVQPPRGVLLHGPPGCGKTLLANAIAGELGVPFISISAPSIVSGMSGESEKTLRDTFEEAKKAAPSLLFIDEIDAITPKRESAQREMERRIVAQFLTCMDDLSWEKTDNKPVIVIGATNRPDSLDAALRRAGRFDHEICMGVPDENAREQILRVLSEKLRLSGDFDFRALANSTPGYVGADLAALTGAAGVNAVKRIFQQIADGTIVLPPPAGALPSETEVMAGDVGAMELDPLAPASAASPSFSALPPTSISAFLIAYPDPLTPEQLEHLSITPEDFEKALTQVQPSSKREGFATVPDVTWSDVGALEPIRDELHMAIVQPIRRPELFKMVGISRATGVLLWGPPGCGKTLLAKAVANESRANFISVKGPELLNKFVGESERAVRQVFTRAAASAPCVIFFDELDALVPRRDDGLSESSSRVVNTLLTELDGLNARESVYVIAATNRPDMIDPAMCRPGRLDKLLYVDLPGADERVDILRTMARKVPLAPGTLQAVHGTLGSVEQLVKDSCEGFSGADLAALIREAGVIALRTRLGVFDYQPDHGQEEEPLLVTLENFQKALEKVWPSVSVAQRRKYETLRSKFAGMPVRGRPTRVTDDDPKGDGHPSLAV